MGAVCDSSLTLLLLSSLAYNKEVSVSFASSCFSSMFIWVVCFAILDINSYEFGVRGASDCLFK